jgi:hypothetical protein
MRNLFFVIVLLAVCLVALPGCLLTGPAEKAAVHQYRLASDNTVLRVYSDPAVPAYARDSALADNEALLAIDALFQGRKVEDVRADRLKVLPEFARLPVPGAAPAAP